jgi:hypothetical protein
MSLVTAQPALPERLGGMFSPLASRRVVGHGTPLLSGAGSF